MPAGVVIPFWLDRPPTEAVEIALNAERLGYGELWVGEMLHFDAFALAGALAAKTQRITLTVGPLALGLRDPVALAMGTASVTVLGGRPARLAVGASSPAVVERWHGRRWGGQAETVAEAVSLIRSVMAGERTAHDGPTYRSSGFRTALGPQSAHITIAGLGPRMLAAGAKCADRLVLNLVTPDQVRVAAAHPVPLAVWVAAAVEPTPAAWAQLTRQLALYLTAPGYDRSLSEAGFSAVVRAARSGAEHSDLVAMITPEMVIGVAAIGNATEVRARLAGYEEAGAEVMVVPVTAGDAGGMRTLAALTR